MTDPSLLDTFTLDLPPIPGVRFIGFGHKARHGKDEAVKAITNMHPRRVQRFVFADALKAHCRVAHGMTVKDGKLLQEIGHGLRGEDPNLWIKALYYHVDELRPEVALISDVRYKNEADFIKKMGGTMIRVRRWVDGVPFVDPQRNGLHVSETHLDDYQFDYTIENDGWLGDLHAKATELFYLLD